MSHHKYNHAVSIVIPTERMGEGQWVELNLMTEEHATKVFNFFDDHGVEVRLLGPEKRPILQESNSS